MSPRYGINDLDWAEVGELNQQGYIDDAGFGDHPVVFDDQFEQRSRQIQHTPPASSALSVIPSKQGPWSGNNQLGIEQPFAPSADNRQTILKLDEWGFPEVWTLCLGLTYDAVAYGANGGLTGSFGVVAEIEFGTGGVIQQVEIDWRSGTSIVLPMNAVNVIASYSSVPTEFGLPALPADLRLRANIVRGNLPQARPTRTFTLTATNTTVEIPPFATSFSLAPRGEVVSAFDFYADLNTVELRGTQSSANVVSEHPRSQFTSYLDVVNQLVGVPTFMTIPEMARFLHINTPGQDVIVQFQIGV